MFIIFHEVLFENKEKIQLFKSATLIDSKKFQFSKCTVHFTIFFLQLSSQKVYLLAPSLPNQNATS